MEAASSSPPSQTATTRTTAPDTSVEQALPQRNDDQEEEQQQQPREYTISFFPKNQGAWVRTLMTSLLGLLVVGLVMSLIAMPRYALVIILFWLLIMSAFYGLACILQMELQRNDNDGRRGVGGGGVFHPVLHALAQAVVDEMEALQDEWRQEILLIKADESSSSSSSTLYTNLDKNGEPIVGGTRNEPFPRTKKKSKLFRIFVKPFIRGGRNGNTSKRSSSKASPPASATMTASSTSSGGVGNYVAPPAASGGALV